MLLQETFKGERQYSLPALFVLLPEYSRSCKTEEQSCGYTACCGGKTACENTEKSVAADGFFYAFGEKVAEARKRNGGTSPREVRQGTVYTGSRQNDACHDIACEYPCGSKFCEVYKELPDRADSSADQKCFENISDHGSILSDVDEV